jgi:uncharacterized protein (DUF488 family)
MSEDSKDSNNSIWTIGHSARSLEEFMALLATHAIQVVVDIRTYPGSRRYPHFNKESLAVSLNAKSIQYHHMAGLGGRRKPLPDSRNSAWRHPAFRGYADHMDSDEFKREIRELETIAVRARTVYMCSEAPWWKCHRALVSDYLKIRGWKVLHIIAGSKASEHPFTTAARTVQGQLFYDE